MKANAVGSAAPLQAITWRQPRIMDGFAVDRAGRRHQAAIQTGPTISAVVVL
jgi:hypothetical protein